MTLVKTLAAAAAGAVAALAGAAAPAQAVDDCPNAAIRAQQGSTRLPDCRAFELVSPADKNGNKIQLMRFVSPAGGVLHFRSPGVFAGGRSNIGADFAAHRTDNGWITTPFVPALRGDRIPRLADSPVALAFSQDFTQAVVRTAYPLYPSDTGGSARAPRVSADLFLVRGDGSHSWLSSGSPATDASIAEVRFVAASDDLSSVLMQSGRRYDPALPDESVEHLWIRRGDRPIALVSVGPDGQPLPVTPGTALMADDGSRIVFESEPAFFGTARLLVHDPVSGTTTEPAFGSARRVCEGAEIAKLSPDGRRLIFRCTTQLTGDPSAGSTALYRADLDTGAVTALGIEGSLLAATDDLSEGYVSGYVDGVGAIWRFGDGAPRSVARQSPVVSQEALSPNGEYFAFKTGGDLGFPTGSLFGETYLYSNPTGQLACITCTPEGNTADDSGYLAADGIDTHGQVSDAGDVFYTAASSLVPTDVNGRYDAYVWHAGRPQLLSSGTAATAASVVGASDDGREAYLISSERLALQDVDNGVPDLYAAKVGGGFAVPAAAPECVGDCQGEPQPFLPPADPGTALFAGPADRDDPAAPRVTKVFGTTPLSGRALAGWARSGRTALAVEVSHAGTVRAVVRARIGRRAGVVVASATRKATGGGSVRLTLRLSSAARRQLRRQGSLKLALRVSYSGRPGVQLTTLTLRAPSTRGAAR
ncbi:hypothetical protein Q5424_02615 [Conexibacter sp. JD483]|uniref:hypothetical protein n=1 Tax=unclassified Conexibacter TaxID=2627773 RepID=UPI0027260994|nr:MULTISPECIES: hypothetical protein [unclassified Conexibacter]MDO8184047.1 hypothetical protein [Conexibacter sp. CPCC 205706]MDO8197039.1 hypothetical protein [Conexibacter sp. CPCC 205762]MDR9367955.1 hypothetical protein [Conexibacter sp. JD483]